MKTGRRVVAGFALGSLAMATAACGGETAGAGEAEGGEVTLGMLMAFSGPTANEGAETVNGCLPAEKVINDAGGVLGRQVTCEPFDTRGTAAEAVPAARQMLSSTPDLLAVLGPSTAEAVAAVPVLEEAGMTMFSVAGDGRFDRSESDYFYRLITSDSVGAKAMALYAEQQGYDNVALVFTSGASAQANIPPFEAAAEVLDLEISSNLTIQPEQPSYRTEVTKLVNSRPDAIIFEADVVTSGTFLTELNQAGGGDIPLVGNVIATMGEWQEAALGAYGSSEALGEVLEVVVRYNEAAGEGYELYDSVLEEMDGENGIDYATFAENVYPRANYDGAIIAALAATKAESIEPADFNALIPEMLTEGEGKTVVETYAEGLEAIEAGDDIQYVGANGEIALNEFHNVTGQFAYYEWDVANDAVKLVGQLDADELAELNVQ